MSEASSSIFLSGTFSILSVGLLMTFKDIFAASDKGKLFGGFLSSLIFLFTVIVTIQN
jgi:hypothetical protein